MKFMAVLEYGPDKQKVNSLHDVHRQHLRKFLENGQLFGAGPLADDAGAVWILEAQDADAAQSIIQENPYFEQGVITHTEVRPLAYWSAKEAKGA